MPNIQQMTVGEVFEIPPGDRNNPSWVNGEFTALVSNIQAKTSKAGKAYWTFTVSDPDDAGIQLEATVFQNPGRYANRIVRFGGQGMSRTEFNGVQQLGLSQKTQMNIVSGQQQAPARNQPRSAPPARGQQSAPPAKAPPIKGETIGMAIKLAGDFMIAEDIEFNPNVLHELASHIIRVSYQLEQGKLGCKFGERLQHLDPLDDPEDLGIQEDAPPEEQAAPKEPKPGPGGSAFPPNDLDEDVPF